MVLGKQKAKQIAKHWIFSNITFGEPFDSEHLSQEQNDLIREECLKVVIKLCNENPLPDTNEIVKHHLKL